LAFCELSEGDVTGHIFHEERKVLVLLLLPHGIFKGYVHVRWAIHLEGVSGNIGRLEERKTLNVVPVEVGKQKSPFSFSAAERGAHEFIAKDPKARAAIQNQQVVAVPHDNTGRIAPVFDRVRPWYWYGPPDAIIL
jgi:hypothetical protein